MTWEVWFIPHAKRDQFIREGWTVEPMPCHHGWFSMIAWRKIR